MKGVVFTEFLGFVESEFDLAMVDHLITATEPASEGAYTAVGTYESDELLAMVGELSRRTETSADHLVKAFGGHLFRFFAEYHADTMGDVSTTEQLLASVEDRIHVDVRKLFPDAELPTIAFRKIDDRTSEVVYQSARPFAVLAEGLIESAIDYFGEPVQLSREDLPPGNGSHARFTLTRQ